MLLDLKKIDRKRVGFFRYKHLDKKRGYLLTNDVGEYCFLNSDEFGKFLSGKIEEAVPEKYSELWKKGFIRDKLNFEVLVKKYHSRNIFVKQGPSLHIIVLTLRCDHACRYCQASAGNLSQKRLDMDQSTAQKVVDRVFESPNSCITIEFQGGEPLINFDILTFIVKYAKKKNKKAKKDLKFTIVSNLTFLKKEYLDFFLDNSVSICTSLDGPKNVHDKYRVASGKKSSYDHTLKSLQTIKREYRKKSIPEGSGPCALCTITPFSYKFYKSIVDEYIKIGMEMIHLRPASPIGYSSRIFQKSENSANAFLHFYRKALDYIITLNFQGEKLKERFAWIFLKKILTNRNCDYLDLRSPCGAGIGQLAYDFNGDVYTCDEGRMLGRLGDICFRLGNIKEDSYRKIANNPIVKTMCIASCLDSLPECVDCVYKSYCGVCPLSNHVVNENIFKKDSFLCQINKGIMDYLFERLQNKKIADLFSNWVSGENGENYEKEE